ncbi:NADH-quinone oxidoreductase subunit NuoE [Thermosediminibacter oceani]|uniref:NADH dehydrogenase (Ubiquinone) 24 kDa subunit n=1 Tax=Thermosediminibacter oceani (strain ATCC BAA-1034 / DSM 16646 / JW/IW-1228P) TaxID=555079 RepID=D9S1N2_THEOJ|nr:NADH-quinone oxidoreductase subunit NuoE [Thermosediminibacter oceani]ADL07309.1 NADH dehydrogenase (ubiquinone) 24 kDa subunit [Thermosediminibacter oceani DSM 16646]
MATATGHGRSFQRVDEIIEAHGRNPVNIISILQEVQNEYRYLPQDVLNYIATAMNISPSKVYGVATFYENFSLEPKGKYVIRICDGTACHVKNSTALLNALTKKLGLKEGQRTTEDLLFTLETVSCLGACGLAPVMVVNEEVHGKVTPEKAEEIIDEIINKERGQNDKER